jgi:hypothetical protein
MRPKTPLILPVQISKENALKGFKPIDVYTIINLKKIRSFFLAASL